MPLDEGLLVGRGALVDIGREKFLGTHVIR
jgi:hypothetical protein